MLNIKYKNCLVINNKIKKIYYFIPSNKNHYIKIFNEIENSNIIISCKNNYLINDQEINKKVKLKILEKQKISLLKLDNNTKLNKIKLYYDNKINDNIILENYNLTKINNFSKIKNSIAIFCHYDEQNIISDLVINNIYNLSLLGYNVIFITTSSKILNEEKIKNKYNIDIIYETNHGSGSEFIIWKKYLKENIKIIKKKYDWILLINDSIAFPVNGIKSMYESINNIRCNCDFWGHWNSYEIQEHLISSIIEYKVKMIDDIINLYELKTSNIKNVDKNYFIRNIEVIQTNYFVKLNYKYKVLIDYKKLKIVFNTSCPIFHPYIFSQWIDQTNTFAIKWKYMLNYINYSKIKNNNLKKIINLIDDKNIIGSPEHQQVYQNSYYFKKHEILFYKYFIGTDKPDNKIIYKYILENHKENKIFWCHIHCYNLDFLKDYFNIIIIEYYKLFNIIVTYSIGSMTYDYDNITYLKIINKGADIGAKLCAINYLQINNINYEYILFFHSKSDTIDRENFIKPFINRSELIINILTDNSKKIDAIFPNYHNIPYNSKLNYSSINYNNIYLDNFLNWLGIEYNQDNINWFNGTNTFLFSKKIIDFIFGNNKLLEIYNILNYENSFDYIWFIIKNNLDFKLDISKAYIYFKENNNIGNCFNDTKKTLPNCCIEHMFERSWINIIKHLNLNYICLPTESIFDFYKIKINAIYFPQFHNSKVNNEFWGEGFTEWTLLKPFSDKLVIRDNHINIMKPHDDIGYYSLDNIIFFQKQIEIANKYNINGFVIYHYWFNNNNSVLNKIEEHLLSGNINFPFCFSWANESWTRQWDGSTNGILISQDYEDKNSYEHINYLIKFFKMPNYMKNNKNECLFYIYNFMHIKNYLNIILVKWKKVLKDNNIKIKIISTINADKNNKSNGTDIKYEFLPLAETKSWSTHFNSKLIINDIETKLIPYHYEIDYNILIENFNSNENKDNIHIGIPLHWNNIVRKKNMPHLHITNFTKDNLKKMILRIISKIILKYTNKYLSENIEKYNILKYTDDENTYDFENNTLIVNAWNEWNEQAVLEPNNITGYENLETINDIVTNL